MDDHAERPDLTPVHALYLEDSEADAALVEALLAEGGIACTLTRVETPKAFAAALEAGGFHLILSDNTLPSYVPLGPRPCPGALPRHPLHLYDFR